jgi:hypothetical protein
MENLDIIILTSVISTLFVVFFILMYRELKDVDENGWKPDPNAKKYGREALFVLMQRLFDEDSVPKKEKKTIYKAVKRTISDMESDGIYFSEEVKEKMKEYRDELHCEYSGLPSPMAYTENKSSNTHDTV